MDRAILLEHLVLAEEHIQRGARTIARQQEIIEKLDAHGHETVEARRMLKTFEDAQAMNIADRERLKKELERAEGRPRRREPS
jgi:hypothetical protein